MYLCVQNLVCDHYVNFLGGSHTWQGTARLFLVGAQGIIWGAKDWTWFDCFQGKHLPAVSIALATLCET